VSDHYLGLPVDRLRRTTDPGLFCFTTTADLEPLGHVIGQERAVRAIDFGIDMPGDGYNIYAMGAAGSGRTTAVRRFLNERAQDRPGPGEWCYVYNFEDPRRPHAIRVPAGRAVQLSRQMDALVQQLQREIPRAFEGEYFEQRRREIVLDLQQRQREMLEALERYLNERGFALIRSQTGLTISPMREGQVLSAEEYDKLDPEEKKRYESHRAELQEQFDNAMRRTRELDRTGKQSLDDITHEIAGFVVDQLMAEIRESFADCPRVVEYLQAVRKDVVDNAARFVPDGEQPRLPFPVPQGTDHWIDHYKVNVLAEVCLGECAPVVVEDNPTYYNLVGRIEHRAEFGAMVTDFTQIRAGALHRANGGYLVVEAKNLLSNPAAWDGLKRALRNRQIKIEEMSQVYGLVATVTLEPEPIPLDVKVVIIGDEMLYHLMYSYDEDFRELFKVRAEFGASIKREDAVLDDYAAFVGDLCRREALLPFDATAVARLVDESARLADDQHRLTTRFADVADLTREAALWARRNGRAVVCAADVRQAVEERRYRLDRVAERYIESITDGVMRIETSGMVVGQVNGLSVMQMAGFTFGMPSRISAKTFLGRSGVVSIDREVKMSGPIHDKGQLILASYLSSRFAQRRALSMSASLTFEQNYSGVEGDSASSTELYAILSSLADVPIRQSLAVTGSVDQSGCVQAIGGVNHKIEGFYAVCKARGLTGDQGVLIPASNVRHLMLSDEVVEAVRAGQFHVYAVSDVREGIELLTGMPAGEPDEDGNYPEGTVFARVQAQLDAYAERIKAEAAEGKADGAKGDGADGCPGCAG
jgi:lon-related putative ATP-dependent protease